MGSGQALRLRCCDLAAMSSKPFTRVCSVYCTSAGLARGVGGGQSGLQGNNKSCDGFLGGLYRELPIGGPSLSHSLGNVSEHPP